MTKINNPNYKRFMEVNEIKFIEKEHMARALDNVKGRHRLMGRCLLIMAYYTGARPSEYLRLQAKDINRESNYIAVKMPASKGGRRRIIRIPLKRAFVKEMWDYIVSQFPETYIFYKYTNKYIVKYVNRKGEIKENVSISDKLRYHFNKWFDGVIEGSIPPYYLRHNRISKFAEKGFSLMDLMLLKGSQNTESIKPYIHMSKHKSIKLARGMD